ncbi:MAG: ATP-binding cassette domain-containing protein [Gemmatimonadetes bacterium]|nr:ATP-binding cassette domain-containing protein [Gemmatimonadota bacterium]
MTEPLLVVQDLCRHYPSGGWLRPGPVVRAVDGVSLELARGETLALVGESGSGKSTLARTLLRLEEPDAGTVRFDGTDVLALSGEALRALRRRMQIVFQDASGALNPRMTVGDAVAEGLEIHRLCRPDERPDRVRALLQEVGLDPDLAGRYPRALSGGQRQRVVIARALAVEPAFLILDEPVSALDVSVQAQVLTLLLDLQQRRGLAYLYIAHDLAVVRQVAHRVAVMYLGRLVEMGPTEAVLAAPAHPYTQALISAVPALVGGGASGRIVLSGDPPSPLAPPAGCAFHPRCFHPARDARCAAERPALRAVGPGQAACHHAPPLA